MADNKKANDNGLKDIIRSEFGKIHADENVKAQILKGLTGDTMKTDKREGFITTTGNAENNEKAIIKETNKDGKAKVAPRGRIAAAAAAVVFCLGCGAFLLKNRDLPDKENANASSAAYAADSSSGNIENVEFNGYFDEDAYTVYDKFGLSSEIWRLSNGKFLVKQSENFKTNTDEVYDYIIYNGETNSIESVLQISGERNVRVYDNGFAVKSVMSVAEMEAETAHLEFYDFNCELVNAFDFDISSVTEDGINQTIEGTEVSHDGQNLFILANVMKNDIFTGNRIYEVTADGKTSVMCDTEEKSQENQIIKISDIYPSNDGKSLYFDGFSYYDNNSDAWKLILGGFNTSSGDVNQAEGFFDCAYNSSHSVMMRSDKLYDFSCTEASFTVLSRKDDNGNSTIGISDYGYDVEKEDDRFSDIADGFYVSYGGKYIIMTQSICNEEDIVTDSYIVVYEADGFNEIYREYVEGSLKVTVNDTVLFDENTGDLCLYLENLGDDHQKSGVYTANVFGNEYSNFGIIQTVTDNNSDVYNDTAATTTTPATPPEDISDEIQDMIYDRENTNKEEEPESKKEPSVTTVTKIL